MFAQVGTDFLEYSNFEAMILADSVNMVNNYWLVIVSITNIFKPSGIVCPITVTAAPF